MNDPARSAPTTRVLLPAIVLVASVAYALAAPAWVLGGDNGEFATLFATGGIAHPPGYPLMVLWLRAFHWLPVASPAHGAALATVILGAGSVWTLQRACLAWGASIGATAFVSTVYAFAPITWKQACHAEVFAMNAMFAGAILALAAPASPLRGGKLTVALGLLAGLAICDQQSIVTLSPIGLLAVARGAREARRPGLAALVGALAFFVGALPPYVYVYWLARTADWHTTLMWIGGSRFADVFFHFRRGEYGWLTLAPLHVELAPLRHMAALASSVVRQLLGLPLLVPIALGAWFSRSRTAAMSVGPRGLWRSIPRRELVSCLMLGASFLLAGPVMAARFNLPFADAGPEVAERFYLLPMLVLALIAALSLDALVPMLLARSGVAVLLTILGGIAAAAVSLPEIEEWRRPTVQLYAENTLLAAPADAIIVGTGDHRFGGFVYASYVMHLRPDVLFINAGMLRLPWYMREMQQATGADFFTPDGKPIGPKTTIIRLLGTGHPLFYTNWPDPKVERTPHYTVGTLMRVLSDDRDAPDADTLAARNTEVFARYRVEPTPPSDPFGWGRGLVVDYARAWGELGQRFAAEGRGDKAHECYLRAAVFAPWTVQGE